MGRIQSSVGLITGIPIAETVDQLLSFSARPRDLLISRNEQLQAERVAVSELTALVIGIQFAVEGIGSGSGFAEREITSSDEALVSVASTGTPAPGAYEFTPIRQAQNNQFLSQRFAASDEPLGGGEFAIRFGGRVDKALSLDELNRGNGIEHGQIRITDRSGTSARIDLRFAQTIDDVLRSINENTEINVTAEAVGDRLTLRDNTGQTVSNLKVQEVAGGSTAADLGLANIDVAGSRATGADIISLHDDLALASLNDGNGVFLRPGVADLEVTFRDGSDALQVEFLAQVKGETAASATTDAANGDDAAVTFESVGLGEEWDGYRVVFENDDEISLGDETVDVDTVGKEIRFKIDSGSTRAAHIVAALNNDEEASELFTAALVPEGDGTGVIQVSDSAETSGGAIAYANEETVGDLLATLNAADPTRLQARINESGNGIELIDLTTPATTGGLWTPGQPAPGVFSVRSLGGGQLAEDLGIAGGTTSDTIVGERRVSGLKTVLLDSLGGGSGLGDLGQISITDRAGNSANIDLTSAETLDDVIQALNVLPRTGVQIEARINDARNGIVISDNSGGTGNLVVGNADATNSADKLRIAADVAASQIDSGSLDLQTFHHGVTLDSLNNGRGIGTGSFLIRDSAGQTSAVNPQVSGAQTVGDLIDQINQLNISVEARINDTGDGLLLVDTAAGHGTLSVTDVGNGAVAANLKIAGTAVVSDIGGVPEQQLDGSNSLRITLAEDDTLHDLVEQINEAGLEVSATLFDSGSGAKPYRLSIASEISGARGELVVDGAGIGVGFQELVSARDAVVALGPADGPVAAALATSPTNEFDSIVDGLTVTLEGASQESVSVNVTQSVEPVISQVELLVEQYNKFRSRLEELTFFNAEENTTGVLFGRSEVLRLEFDLTGAISGRFFGAGPIQSLGELGISLNGEGELTFDADRFRSKYEQNAEAVEKFLTDEDFGVAKKLVSIAEQLAGVDNSVLINRTLALQRTMENNDERIAALNLALDRERESLLEEFFRLETAIGRLQNNSSALGQIQSLAPLNLSVQ